MKYWKVPEMWSGGDCWIIGGGSSMPRMFGVPDNILTTVESGQEPITVYSDYLKPLHNQNVIGTNLAFLLGDWISAMYFCDAQFFLAYHEKIKAFPNLKATCVGHLSKSQSSKNIKRLRRDERKGLSNNKEVICWNHNSGAAAINLAVLAGAKRILLLGFDMKPAEDGRTHWHEGYQFYTSPTIKHSFKRFMRGMAPIARDAKQRKIEILNVNPDSAIPDFRKVTLRDIL